MTTDPARTVFDGVVTTTEDAANLAIVNVPITGLWSTPSSPRDIDAAIVAHQPDHAQWLRDLDATGDLEGRMGLYERLDSELLEGDPVIVSSADEDGWTKVTTPWQLYDGSETGYPGYVRTTHLQPTEAAGGLPGTGAPRTVDAFIAATRSVRGLAYLWGGISPAGLDCSGLVYHGLRSLGIVFARDAGDQYRACDDVPIDQARFGDLYFFAEPDLPIHHVGIVTGPGRILHAPSTGSSVVEEDMPKPRQDTLVAIGRIRQIQ